MKIALKLLGKIKNIIEKGINYIQRKTDRQFEALVKWYEDDPHGLKRSTFSNMSTNSIVFDLGGYEGQWASDIVARYNCKVMVFEPVREYAELINNRFKQNDKVSCFAYGLSSRTYDTTIYIDEFASSTFATPKSPYRKEVIHLKDFSAFTQEMAIERINLMKINIEGGEYDLLEYFINENLTSKIDQLLIQFHNFIPKADERKAAIKKQLTNTHTVVFDYEYLWEHWKLKD